MSVEPTNIDGGGNVTIKIDASDTGSGISYISASLSSPSNLSHTQNSGSAYLSPSLTYNSTSQLWEGTVTVENNHESGTWKVSSINLNDKAGNSRNYSSTIFYDTNYTQSANYVYWANSSSNETNIPVANLEVTGTVINNDETNPPIINSITITPTTFTNSATLSITIDATDVDSGIESCDVRIYSPTKQLSYNAGVELSSYLTYNETAKLCEGSIEIMDYHEAGNWKVVSIDVRDKSSNHRTLSSTPYYDYNNEIQNTNYVYWENSTNVETNIPIIEITKN